MEVVEDEGEADVDDVEDELDLVGEDMTREESVEVIEATVE